jgi:hypothetical protein
MFGPRAWIKGGFRSTSYNLPVSADALTAADSYKSVFVGLGGELPLRGEYGALLNLDFGLFPSASQTGLTSSGSETSAADVAFMIGGYYRYNPRMTFRIGVAVNANSANFTNNTLSEKTITLVPSLLYYF